MDISRKSTTSSTVIARASRRSPAGFRGRRDPSRRLAAGVPRFMMRLGVGGMLPMEPLGRASVPTLGHNPRFVLRGFPDR